jgi:DNA-binding response OmpR family regulator
MTQQPASERPPSVVIVAADHALAQLLHDALVSDGWAASICAAADDPRRLIQREAAVLIVIGLELASSKAAWILLNNLRADPATAWLPILFVTADARLAREQGALLRGEGYALLETPFDVGVFLAAVRAQVDGGRRRSLESGQERTPLP